MIRALFLLVLCHAAQAQEVTEEMRVILRETRVHVLDGDGNPLRGLARDDFVLTENGTPQTLTYFREVDYTSLTMAPGEIIQKVDRPRRVTVMVLDTSNMMKADFDALIASTADFIREDLSPEDMVKLVQLDGEAVALTRFTTDREALLAGLETAVYRGDFRQELRSVENEIVGFLPEFIRYQSDVQRWRTIADRATGEERQNALREADRIAVSRDNIARQIDHEVTRKELAKARHYRGFFLQMQYIARMLAPVDGTRSILLMSGGLYLEQAPDLVDTQSMSARLARLLNSHKITVYSIHQANRLSLAESQLQMTESSVRLDRFKQINSLATEFSDTPTGKIRRTDNSVVENNRQYETGVRAAAEDSGGLFQRGLRGNLAEMLTEVRTASSHFYLLGYQVDGQHGEAPAMLEIELSDDTREAELIYGRRFARDIPYRDLAADEQEIVFKADLLHAIRRRDDLEAALDGYVFANEGERCVTVVTARLTREEGAERYDLGFAALDAEREPLDFAFTSLPDLPDQTRLDFYDVLLTERRPAYIRFAVRNPANNAYSILEAPLEGAQPTAGQARISDLIIAGDARKTLPLHQLRVREMEKKDIETVADGQTLRVQRDPLALAQRSYRPNGMPSFAAPEKLDVFFRIEAFAEADPKLVLQFLTKSEAGISGPAMELVHQERIDDETLFYHCRLDVSALEPGKHEVWLRVTDRNTEAVYLAKHEIVIEGKG